MFSEEIRIIRLTADVAEIGGVADDDTWEKTQKETGDRKRLAKMSKAKDAVTKLCVSRHNMRRVYEEKMDVSDS